MPNPARPRPFLPRSRAEALANLDAVKQACQEDPGYLASVVKIAADVLLEANSKTEPAPPGETAAARAMRLGKNRVEQMQRFMFEQVANRGAA